jgi:hypothetical protein
MAARALRAGRSAGNHGRSSKREPPPLYGFLPHPSPATAVARTALPLPPMLLSAGLLAAGLLTLFANDSITNALFTMNTTSLFFIAIPAAILSGVLLRTLIETTLMRPLYEQPFYQTMLTLGLSFIGSAFVHAVWGGQNSPCPSRNSSPQRAPAITPRSSILGKHFANQCSVPMRDSSYMPIRCGQNLSGQRSGDPASHNPLFFRLAQQFDGRVMYQDTARSLLPNPFNL